MKQNQFIPLGEKEGSLKFLSDKLNDIDQERSKISVRSSDIMNVFNTTSRSISSITFSSSPWESNSNIRIKTR